MHTDPFIAAPAARPLRGSSWATDAFLVLAVLLSMNAFYFLFANRPANSAAAAEPSARGNLIYVGLWLLLYGGSTLVLVRDAWRRGISLALLALLPFAAYVALSSLWANRPMSSLVFAVMLDFNIVIAAALAVVVSPRRLLSIMAWTTVVLAAISLVLLVLTPGSVVSTPDRPGLLMAGELFGVFAHKAALGMYTSLALLVLVFVDRTRWRWRAPAMAVLAVALLLSNSMSSVAGFAVAALTLMLANRAGPYRNVIIGTVLTLVVVLSAVLPFIDFSWMAEALDRAPTLTGRTDFWKLASGFFNERPLLGYGYHSFFDQTPFSQVWALRATEEYFFTPNFHNTVLDTMIGLGFVGVVGYLAILAMAGRVFLNATMDPSVSGTLAAALILLTLSAAVDFTFLAHNSLPTILLFYAFLVAGRDYRGTAPLLLRALPIPQRVAHARMTPPRPAYPGLG